MVSSVFRITSGLIIIGNIEALWGSCWYLSGPIQVFPGHPDDPAVIKPMVMSKQQVYHSLAKDAFYMITAVVELCAQF